MITESTTLNQIWILASQTAQNRNFLMCTNMREKSQCWSVSRLKVVVINSLIWEKIIIYKFQQVVHIYKSEAVVQISRKYSISQTFLTKDSARNPRMRTQVCSTYQPRSPQCSPRTRTEIWKWSVISLAI